MNTAGKLKPDFISVARFRPQTYPTCGNWASTRWRLWQRAAVNGFEPVRLETNDFGNPISNFGKNLHPKG